MGLLHAKKNKEDKRNQRRAKRIAFLIAWLKMYSVKDISRLGKLSLRQLEHLKKLAREKKFDSLAQSDDKNQLWQLIQIEKGITEQNWMIIRQNEQMMRQNDEIIRLLSRLKVRHHTNNQK